MPVLDISDVAAGLDQPPALPAPGSGAVAGRPGMKVEPSQPLEITAVEDTAAGKALLLCQPGAMINRQLADAARAREIFRRRALAQIDAGAHTLQPAHAAGDIALAVRPLDHRALPQAAQF